ncbi:tetratricopeptide repeat-containing sulfotransferase family protein [Rhodanobacter sp. MP1X3]|uniref:tetratricopeptide repeat-containing sulfotransferase family protein n=1 Tax=Rhodanobacter sp. MP1X3 TaxID=2723086 RepID=UPI0016113844|nr:tetratricopeptide repeat-containing sulfotransferase family protein [Rhodanobacter sp. MP1X3]MBB6241160.1 Flp pilus assembly protein TadD [Rhodanobacter sp. MP1X3]
MSFENIVAAIQSGNLTDAETLSSAQLRGQPDNEDLLLLLAISLQLQKRSMEATSVYAHLTTLYPENSAHWANYATALRESGRLEEAENSYEMSIRLDPGNPFPRIHLGLMLIERHDYVGAREVLLDAFYLDKRSPLARVHGARACCLCQDFTGAEDLLRPWREWLPLNDDDLQIELSRLLILLSYADSALLLLEDLAQRNSENFEAKLLLAGLYERMNRVHQAEALVASVAAQNELVDQNTRLEVSHSLAKLALRKGDASHARMLLEQVGERHENDYAHHYELAEAYDKTASPELAMRSLHRAHELHSDDLKIASPEHFLPDARAMPAEVPRVTQGMFLSWPKLQAPDARHSPVFIVGFPRSGTTLLEQMLDAHPDLQSMDENPFFNRLNDKLWHHDPEITKNLALLQQRDCDELRKAYLIMVSEKIERRWDAQLVDKNPLNMLWLPIITRLFPESKFILALRHPCDVILSCYMQNFRSSVLASASASLSRLAAAYVQAMERWLEDVKIFQPNVYLSRYEELVENFPQQTKRLAQFLELEDASPMLKFDQRARDKGYIGTPSYSQVIVPVNTKGLNRWHRYRREFEPVLPILEPMLSRWGYSAD